MSKKTSILFPAVSAILACSIAVSGYLLFKNHYYLEVYIDGISMQPTLNADYIVEQNDPNYLIQKNVEYGYVEQSKEAINNIKKFDIITVYYPWESRDYNQPYIRNSKVKKDASFKIKRVIALPNETFKIDENVISYKENGEWVSYDLPFNRKLNVAKMIGETTMGKDEYWVMGDNYGNSNDCSDHGGGKLEPVYYENIKGVLVSIRGKCDVQIDRKTNKATLKNKKDYSKSRIYF